METQRPRFAHEAGGDVVPTEIGRMFGRAKQAASASRGIDAEHGGAFEVGGDRRDSTSLLGPGGRLLQFDGHGLVRPGDGRNPVPGAPVRLAREQRGKGGVSRSALRERSARVAPW